MPISTRGDIRLLDEPLLGVFCSVKCPGDVILKSYDLARQLRVADLTVISGVQSPMERGCLALLLRGTARIIICPARGLSRMRITADWKRPIADGRLLLLSFFDDKIWRATAHLDERAMPLLPGPRV